MDIGPDFFLDILWLGISSQSEEAKHITKKALDLYNTESAENSLMNDPSTKLYMGILREMISTEVDVNNQSDVSTLLLKFKHNPVVDKDPTILKNIENIFTNRTQVQHRRVQSIIKKVKTWLMWAFSHLRTRKMSMLTNKLAQSSDPIKQDIILNQLNEQGKEFAKSIDEISANVTSNIGFIDMSCISSVGRTIDQHSSKKKGSVLRLGWEGLNKSLGSNGGLVVGEFMGIAASSHNFKSGLLMNMLRWIVTLNDAPKTDDRTPCVVFISLENEIDENMMSWFKDAYANIFKTPPPPEMTNDEIIKFVVDVFGKRGWKVFVYREMGETFGYTEWVKIHTDLAANGFKVVASIIDYITLMNAGQGDNRAVLYQNLANKLGNYGRHNNFCVITGLQLNTEAQILESSGKINVVKHYGASHLADSKGYKKEFDVLMFIYIERNHQGIPYLTCRIDKHRYVHNTPDVDKYFAYQFPAAETNMPILDDIFEQYAKYVRDIYSDGSNSDNSSASGF